MLVRLIMQLFQRQLINNGLGIKFDLGNRTVNVNCPIFLLPTDNSLKDETS